MSLFNKNVKFRDEEEAAIWRVAATNGLQVENAHSAIVNADYVLVAYRERWEKEEITTDDPYRKASPKIGGPSRGESI